MSDYQPESVDARDYPLFAAQPSPAPTVAQSQSVSRQTQHDAWTAHAGSGRQSAEVYEEIRKTGEGGLTRHEVAERLGIALSSVCGRVAPMLASGQLCQLGARREGRAVLVAREVLGAQDEF